MGNVTNDVGIQTQTPKPAETASKPQKFGHLDKTLSKIHVYEEAFTLAQQDLVTLNAKAQKIGLPARSFKCENVPSYVPNVSLPFSQLLEEAKNHCKTLKQRCKEIAHFAVKFSDDIKQEEELNKKVKAYETGMKALAAANILKKKEEQQKAETATTQSKDLTVPDAAPANDSTTEGKKTRIIIIRRYRIFNPLQ